MVGLMEEQTSANPHRVRSYLAFSKTLANPRSPDIRVIKEPQNSGSYSRQLRDLRRAVALSYWGVLNTITGFEYNVHDSAYMEQLLRLLVTSAKIARKRVERKR